MLVRAEIGSLEVLQMKLQGLVAKRLPSVYKLDAVGNFAVESGKIWQVLDLAGKY